MWYIRCCLMRSGRHLMLSTKRNSLFQRTPPKKLLSGFDDHQMNIGLPTIWSSGTNPQ